MSYFDFRVGSILCSNTLLFVIIFSMKKLVQSKKEKAEVSELIFLHDIGVPEHTNSHRFRYSKAKLLLKEDLDRAFDSNIFLTPMKLWQSRDEYQEFSLETFRSSYFSMKAKMIAMPYWGPKRNKLAHRMHLERAEKMKDQFDELNLANQMKSSCNV